MRETKKTVQSTMRVGTRGGAPVEVPVELKVRVTEHEDGRRDVTIRVPTLRLAARRPKE